ncbi:MAG: HAMP domain-containing sensor histidine kinase [Bacteroidota bacterium]
MKLLTKTSLHYFWASLLLLGIFGTLLFVLLKKEISLEIKEQLELQVDLIGEKLNDGATISYPLVDITKVNQAYQSNFRDTSIFDRKQNVAENYYALTEYVNIKKQTYAVTVMTTYIGWNEYLETIGLTFLGLSLLLAVTGLLVNYVVSRQIWKPFLQNLATLKNHSLASDNELTLQPSDTEEFEELNKVLIDFASRAKTEYHALQEFSENSSHELQTPIAIIRARLESISQHPLDTESIRYLNDAKTAIERLSKVNKSLLLLTKLRNGHFPDVQTVCIDKPLLQHIEQLDELYINRELRLKTSIKTSCTKASPYLLEVLLSNLLSNQIKYAPKSSTVSISLDDNALIFTNAGPPLSFEEDRLFKRFVKGKQEQSGAGLGLSIVMQICKLHGWNISYAYHNQLHIFTIRFN